MCLLCFRFFKPCKPGRWNARHTRCKWITSALLCTRSNAPASTCLGRRTSGARYVQSPAGASCWLAVVRLLHPLIPCCSLSVAADRDHRFSRERGTHTADKDQTQENRLRGLWWPEVSASFPTPWMRTTSLTERFVLLPGTRISSRGWRISTWTRGSCSSCPSATTCLPSPTGAHCDTRFSIASGLFLFVLFVCLFVCLFDWVFFSRLIQRPVSWSTWAGNRTWVVGGVSLVSYLCLSTRQETVLLLFLLFVLLFHSFVHLLLYF